MPRAKHLDDFLKNWPFKPELVNVRRVRGGDGRKLIQIRIEMGILQLETSGRPDGLKPHGQETYLDYLKAREVTEPDFVLTDEECLECDREFTQFFHRRMSWMALQEYTRTALDANHTLELMDVCSRHAPSVEWAGSHERHRPFVLFQRTQAEALGFVRDNDAAGAISAINRGLTALRGFVEPSGEEERGEGDNLMENLVQLRESLRTHFKFGRTLDEQLADAIATEQYELAARLRDEIQALKLSTP